MIAAGAEASSSAAATSTADVHLLAAATKSTTSGGGGVDDDGGNEAPSTTPATVVDVHSSATTAGAWPYFDCVVEHWMQTVMLSFLLFAVILLLSQAGVHVSSVRNEPKYYKNRKTSAPFFPVHSSVLDFYDGQLIDGDELLNMSEVVFAMYYAPWCLASMEARDQFDTLATHFGRRCLFVAVNCWDPGGRCRRERSMHSYPLLELSTAANARLLYRGVVSADHMYRFLELSADPLQRLQNDVDVAEFLARVEARVIGYFSFARGHSAEAPDGRAYTSFYLASLKALERDPLRSAVVFAVVTEARLAALLNLTTSGQILLFQWRSRENLTFPDVLRPTSQNIVDWVFGKLRSLMTWFIPEVSKNARLQQAVDSRSAVLLTPWRPLFGTGTAALTMQQLALSYYDCRNGSHVDRLRGQSLRALERRRHLRSLLSWREMGRWCGWAFAERQRYATSSAAMVGLPCGALSPAPPANGSREGPDVDSERSCFCRPLTWFKAEQEDGLFWRSLCEFARWCDGSGGGCCDFGFHLPSVLPYCEYSSDTDQLARPWRRRYSADECHRFRLAQALNYTSLGESFVSSPLASSLDFRGPRNDDIELGSDLQLVRGLGCKANRSLKFITIDADRFQWFFGQFGFRVPRETELFIYDAKKEEIFAHVDAVSMESVARFVYNYTSGRNLPVLRRSEELPAVITSPSSFSHAAPPSGAHPATSRIPASSNVYIAQMTSQSFDSVVFGSSKDVFVFYNSRWCLHCQTIYHLFQTCSTFFHSSGILFAQADGVSYFFTGPVTLSSMISFVLSHCSPSVRIDVFLKICSKHCWWRNLVKVGLECRKLGRRLVSAMQNLDHTYRLMTTVPIDAEVKSFLTRYFKARWSQLSKMAVRHRLLAQLSDMLLTAKVDRMPLLRWLQRYNLMMEWEP